MRMYDAKLERLPQIFASHCALSAEEYEEIDSRLINLEADVQEREPIGNIEAAAGELSVIFDFLYNIKRLTLEEYNELCNLVNGIRDDAQRMEEEGA